VTWRRLAIVPRLAALLGTSYFLVATSAPVEEDPWLTGTGTSTSTFTTTSNSPQSCWHSAESVSFHVTGTCGPEGDIVVSSPFNECAIMVQGAAAVGLPSAGRFDSASGGLTSSAWHLSGYLAEGSAAGGGQGDAAVFTVIRDGGVGAAPADGGTFTVVADAGADARGFTVVTDAGAAAHGKAVLRTCTHQTVGADARSLACSDDGRAACTAVLTLLP
jgi:hypothetical protein